MIKGAIKEILRKTPLMAQDFSYTKKAEAIRVIFHSVRDKDKESYGIIMEISLRALSMKIKDTEMESFIGKMGIN